MSFDPPMSFDLTAWASWAQLISLLGPDPLFYAGSGFLRDRQCGRSGLAATSSARAREGSGTPEEDGQSGGSVTCNSRMMISAVFGDGNPTDVRTSSNSSLAHRVRTRSSDSQTPMMYSASSPMAQ